MHDLKFILICFSNSFVIWFKFKINDWNLYWNKVLALTLYLFLSVQLARLYIIEQLFKLRRKYCSQQKNISLVLERFHRRSQYRLIPRHKNSLLNEKCKTVLNNCTRYAHICNVFTRYQHKKWGFHISCVVVPYKKVYETYINSVEVHHIWSKSGYEWHRV